MSPFLKQRNLTLVIYAVLLLPISGLSQITPTFEWVNFYGNNSTLNGEPLSIGTRIEARDPDSVLCGEYVVTTPGKYGFLSVYRDDPFTPEVDEGAISGDTIQFSINGLPALVLGPDSPVWTANGDSRHVELAASGPTHVSESKIPLEVPRVLELKAYPNPARDITTVVINISGNAVLNIRIYDVRGALVRRLSPQSFRNERYLTVWDGRDQEGQFVSSGIYFVNVELFGSVGVHRQTKKILMIR